jgi:protein ImuB
LLLFDPPQKLQVIAAVPAAVSAAISEGPPQHFRWRGRPHRVLRQEGPERIAAEWWRRRGGHADNPGLTRDYYRVEDDSGHRFWLFRHGLRDEKPEHPDWYVHGLFA